MQTLLLSSLEIPKVIMKLKLLLSAFSFLSHVSQSFLTRRYFLFLEHTKKGHKTKDRMMNQDIKMRSNLLYNA